MPSIILLGLFVLLTVLFTLLFGWIFHSSELEKGEDYVTKPWKWPSNFLFFARSMNKKNSFHLSIFGDLTKKTFKIKEVLFLFGWSFRSRYIKKLGLVLHHLSNESVNI